MDLRRWQCGLCGFSQLGLTGDGSKQVEAHLNMAHRDHVMSRGGFSNMAHLGCQTCPTFTTSDLSEWRRHFSSDFLSCVRMGANYDQQLFVSGGGGYSGQYQEPYKPVMSQSYQGQYPQQQVNAYYQQHQEQSMASDSPWRTHGPVTSSSSRHREPRDEYHHSPSRSSRHHYRPSPYHHRVEPSSSQSSRGFFPPRRSCLYCPERLPSDQLSEHVRWVHYDLQFWCKRCPKAEAYFKEMLKHVIEAHDSTLSPSSRALPLFKADLILLPKDLRGLSCRLCSSSRGSREKYILAQDRIELKEHIRRDHGVRISLSELSYTCRGCNEDFRNTEDFLKHECCEANGQNGRLPQPLMKEASTEGNTRRASVSASNDGDSSEVSIVATVQKFDDAGRPIGDIESISGKQTEEEKEEKADQCLYCPLIVPRSTRASHRSKHLLDEIDCLLCTKSFNVFSDLKAHFEQVHADKTSVPGEDFEMESADLSNEETVKQFIEAKRMKLPKDLRKLECQYCLAANESSPFVALCQGRFALAAHIKAKHEGEKTELKQGYKCRACNSDFKSGDALTSHPCYLLNGGFRSLNPVQIHPTEELIAFDPALIEFEPPAAEGDLRRMVCRLCSWQSNGEKFHVMVEHLERKHGKKQYLDPRSSLESFVHLSCASCPNNKTSFDTVQAWDAHFLGGGYEKCVGEGSSTKLKEVSVFNDVHSMETDKEEQQTRNEKDIRRLECSLCGHEESRTKFLPMQLHLRKDHLEQTAELTELDSLVIFKCRECPEFKPKTLREWDSHFYKSYEWCKVSWKAKHNPIVKKKDEQVEMDIEEENDEKEDLRLLSCLLCPSFSLPGAAFYPAMSEHLLTAHHQQDSDRGVRFGCSNCPGYSPPATVKWARHFSKSYKSCQGSGRIKDLVKKKVLFWCDLCRETRDDFDGHLQRPSHKTQVEARQKLIQEQDGDEKAGEEKAEEDKAGEQKAVATVSLFNCDLCQVCVGSEANKRLHEKLAMHQEKEKELLRADE